MVTLSKDVSRTDGSAGGNGYMSGFGNEHSCEALPNALPVGRFSPQKCAYGLYAEKLSSTAFTVPRAQSRRTWLYRIRPSVVQGEFRQLDHALLQSAPLGGGVAIPNQLRWDPFPIPQSPCDFIDGLVTMAANGDVLTQTGIGIHLYRANRSMEDRYFYNADGEVLIVPQQGGLRMLTECGILLVVPGEICVVPRGMKFRVELCHGGAVGYVCENYGAPLTLPERGPVGSDGFANDRDFLTPVAAFEERTGSFQLLAKFGGNLFACDIGHSPLDVVAWVGNSVPYKYDLRRFNVMGSISYDHPDPSIFTVLTSPSDTAGVANVDFVIFPERWMVAEGTFRPPWYHRNVMSEFMGLICGTYDAKPSGFLPGGASLHNSMSAHGPDTDAFEQATNARLEPVKLPDTLAFMFESRFIIKPSEFALRADQRQRNYLAAWQSLPVGFSTDRA
ncbi:MAG: homogentisate 1,2-dioxygenase [Gammaproteobacteria bacterium]|nr:homogentisate 1,2-dioxygenase [Gammaproteobacteria bacterium]